MLCSFGAYATGENERVTSMGYVTEELADRQDKFDKLGADTAVTYSGSNNGEIGSRAIAGDLGAESNTSSTAIPTVGAVDTKLENKQDELDLPANTVLMNTGVAGEPAAKGIYQTSGDYNTQVDSLVDAATFNAALQNAINSELSCAQRKDPNDPTSKCLLFNIFAPTQNLMIPNTYTRLEYLEGTGPQYINTGIVANSDNFRIVVKFNVLQFRGSAYGEYYYDGVLGNYAGENYNTYRILLRAKQGNCTASDINCNLAFSGYANTRASGGVTISAYRINLNTDYIIDMSQDMSMVNGQVEPRRTVVQAEANTRPIRLFAGGSGGTYNTSHTRIYYFSLYNGGTLVRDMIPARRNSDGELGMYDTVSGTFFTNAGNGTFIAGPELSSNIYLPMN